jgi:hypothetical protein
VGVDDPDLSLEAERSLKVGDGLPLPLAKPALDLMRQDIAAPAVFDGSAEVPLPLLPLLKLVEEHP